MVAAMAAVGIVTFGAQPQAAGVKAGVLTCNVSSGWGFIIGASRDLRCVYTSPAGPPDHYSGSISKFGVDIGYQQSAVIVWGVIAPTAHLNPGGLAGLYGGVTGGASVGAGLGANVLVAAPARRSPCSRSASKAAPASMWRPASRKSPSRRRRRIAIPAA